MTQIGIDLVRRLVESTKPISVFSNIDHVFNGMRIGVLRRDSLALVENVRIFYFADDGKVIHRRLRVDGSVVDGWPDGMFDQNLKNVAELGRSRRAAAN